MNDAVSPLPAMLHTRQMTEQARRITDSATNEPRWVQWLMIAGALLFLLAFLLLPLVLVFAEALRGGWETFLRAIVDRMRCRRSS